MAVMTSQPDSTTAALADKSQSQSQSLNMATSTSPAPIGDKRNGDAAEVNGHASPAESQPDKRTEDDDAAKKDNAPSQTQLKDTEASNKDGFVSNQTITAMTPPGAEGATAKEPEAVDKTDTAAAQPDQVDTEMTDAPLDPAKPPSPPAEPVPDASTTAAEAPGEDGKAESTTQDPEQSSVPAEPTDKPESVSEEAAPTSDAPTVAADSADKVEESQASQATAKSEESRDVLTQTVNIENPGDLMTPTVSMSKMGLDVAENDTTAPTTVDTSMTDAPSQSSTKVSRGREDDDSEPAAKRTKVDGDDAAGTPPKSSHEPANEDAMAIDQPSSAPTDVSPTAAHVQSTAPASKPTPAGSPIPLSTDGKARALNDRALDNNPITIYQNREIRKVLGLVKKTKQGQHFRQPVQTLWPTVWDQYRQLIDRPVDISFIEQNLRDNRYSSLGAFRKDVELLHQNAVTFNGAQHDVTTWAKGTVKQIDERLAAISAEEPQKPAKQEPKQMPTRHAEPRNPPPPPKAKEPRPTPAAPAEKSSDNQIYALLPSGLPNIRRDSTKTDSDRPKRPIHPPKNKDLGMAPKSGKNKKKPELRFCEEVLKEVMHSKNWQQNQWFTTPVDPVALNIPTYHSIIKQPMDLGTMNEKLQRGEYESAKDFKSDFNLIVKNCVKFNGEPHPVTDAVKQLEALFEKKWSEKASWMSKHAQSPARAATSPRANVKEEADTDASEPEQDHGDELKEALRAVNAVTERLKQEQAELDKKLYSDDPDMSAIETHRTVINFLTNEMVSKRQALNKLQENKKTSQPKASNKKKGSGAGGSGGGGGTSKKSAQAGAGSSKKSGTGAAKPRSQPKKLSDEEKEIVSEAIGRLDGHLLERAIAIIKKDAKLEATEDDELELDMDQLSDYALVKLYELVLKQFPEYRTQLKKSNANERRSPVEKSVTHTSKPKKNKPMGKDEQERKLQQLRELKDSYKRPGSGSQEPLPSVENNDTLVGDDNDETDASSSEEE